VTPYYDENGITIYHGDMRHVVPELGEMFDLIVTDPPYFQPATHYVPARGTTPIRTLGDTSVLELAFELWSTTLDRVLAADGTAYVFCDGQSYPIVYRTFYRLGLVRPLVWDKLTSYNGYTWRHQHELIAWVERPDAERVPTGDGDILQERAVPVDARRHPAEKPVGLMARLMAKHGEGSVLDPFMGSGSSMEAARQVGSRYVGVEIEERYCEIAVQRLAQGVLEFS
jgi:site-specific DNA-methyltransferase (adenine-specific)